MNRPSHEGVSSLSSEIFSERPYQMKISMSVLDALGIRLYSNVAAVLSELVANAWDADANLVEIVWTKDSVSITDDGVGMSRDDLIDRFLTVGYSKRKDEGTESERLRRKFMGRKGIGKLSVFSVANTVEVHTQKNTDKNALRIELEKLREQIEIDSAYEPDSIPVDKSFSHSGTRLQLSGLNTQRMSVTAAALRKRLARRFDVLTLTPVPSEKPLSEGASANDAREYISKLRSKALGDDPSAFTQLASTFIVIINGEQITFNDRVDFGKLEYLWEFGAKAIPDSAIKNTLERFVVQETVSEIDGWNVSGWFGTSAKPKDLDSDEEAGTLKGLIILARGRPIQEDISGQLNFNRMFGNYLTGQIRADFLDDGDEDIATSDRQRLMEDDPRVIALAKYLRRVILDASDTWAELRPKAKTTKILSMNPELNEWVESLSPYKQVPAQRLIGAIETIKIPENTTGMKESEFKKRLYQSSIIAFERLALREDVQVLEQLATMDLTVVMPILSELSSYENLLFADVIRAKLEVIRSFNQDIDGNELEKVLQKDIHKNMWLLDPAWGPATADVRMEERLRHMAEAEGSEAGVSANENARMDLRYCNLQGRHVIVELKRPGVKTDVEDLYEQGLKYLRGLDEVLKEKNRDSEFREIVFILGKTPSARMCPPGQNCEDYVKDRLKGLPGRILMYKELVASAQQQYQEYIDAQKDHGRVADLLNRLDRGSWSSL